MYVDRYEHLSHLDLPDSADSEGRMDVDVLIRSDYYWRLTTGETI